ncbi:MAG: leucine-rich repeat domain-containing protein [Clostridia bacterium]|nr:leucine-rich repeat domain-containing protein [Clostridia bacterium]
MKIKRIEKNDIVLLDNIQHDTFFISDSDSLYYYTQNGCLYSKNKTTLLYVPNIKGAMYVPDHVRIIERRVFNFQEIKHIILPEVRVIKDQAFKNCEMLHAAYMPYVQTIHAYAFAICTELTKICMPEVIQVNNFAFWGTNINCLNLYHITSIGNNAFAYCKHLETINIKTDKSLYIGKYAFADSGVQNVYISAQNGLSIATGAFCNCKDLEYVKFVGIEGLDLEVFTSCPKLKQVIIPDECVIRKTLTAISYKIVRVAERRNF